MVALTKIHCNSFLCIGNFLSVGNQSYIVPAEGEFTKYLIIAFFSDRFGVRVGLLSGELVIGLVTFPDSIQPVIAARS